MTTLPAIFIQPCLRKALKLSLMTSLTEEMKFHSLLWMQLKHQLFHSSFSLKGMPLPDGVSMNLSKSSNVKHFWQTGSDASSNVKIIFSEGYASSKHQLFHSSCYRFFMAFGSFGDSFLKLEERFKENSGKLQTWRNALKEAAGLSGFHFQ